MWEWKIWCQLVLKSGFPIEPSAKLIVTYGPYGTFVSDI